MSVDLLAGDDIRSISPDGFRILLALAHSHGWKPAGTLPPPQWEEPGYVGPTWEGTYLTSDFQTIAPEDGAAIAAALERAASSPEPLPASPRTLRGWAAFFRSGSVVIG